jgi:uncharacterized protein YndB with AHSA1/START domain
MIERTLDAPIELVWSMWTDPEHFAAWYGPDGASIPEAEMDVRVGGARRVAMQVSTPGGMAQMWFTGEYRQVEAPERLGYTESMADEHGTVLQPADLGMPADHPTVTEITVELRDLGGRTILLVTHAGIPADSPGASGWNMALDKLIVHLETVSA